MIFYIRLVGTEWYARLDPMNGWENFSKPYATTFTHRTDAEAILPLLKHVDGMCYKTYEVIEEPEKSYKYAVKSKIVGTYLYTNYTNYKKNICETICFVTKESRTLFEYKDEAKEALMRYCLDSSSPIKNFSIVKVLVSE